jgi:hypothetical protein
VVDVLCACVDDPADSQSDLTDIDTLTTTLDATLFPGVPDGVETHDGFTDEHAKTATQILTEVKRLMGSKGTNSVTLVGHAPPFLSRARLTVHLSRRLATPSAARSLSSTRSSSG